LLTAHPYYKFLYDTPLPNLYEMCTVFIKESPLPDDILACILETDEGDR
jgi:hypothetical protein